MRVDSVERRVGDEVRVDCREATGGDEVSVDSVERRRVGDDGRFCREVTG